MKTERSKSTSTLKESYLRSLALSLALRPDATLQELATSIGVSKATLYRFCRTRAELIDRLIKYCASIARQIMSDLRPDDGSVMEVLERISNLFVQHKEFWLFIQRHWRVEFLEDAAPDDIWRVSKEVFDALFLKAQKDGLLRIDISAAAMVEAYFAINMGLFEAERQGRIPRAGLAQLGLDLFLNGGKAHLVT